jgi:hypothetical protein
VVSQKIIIPAANDADLWFGVNVRGKVHYAIRTRDGTNKVKMWWVKWGFGSVEQLGDRTAEGSLDTPSGLLDKMYRLRAQAYDTDTIVYISDRVVVSPSVKFDWPLLSD